jgi:hypothetical protein
MKKGRLIILLFLLPVSFGFAQTNCRKCDIDKIAPADKNIGKLNSKILGAFLCTFDSSCSNNAEYSEWSNKVLYKVIETNPTLFFSVLQKNEAIDLTILVKEIQSPLLDYNFQAIYDKVRLTTGPQNLKILFLDALEKAAEEDGQKIKK